MMDNVFLACLIKAEYIKGFVMPTTNLVLDFDKITSIEDQEIVRQIMDALWYDLTDIDMALWDGE